MSDLQKQMIEFSTMDLVDAVAKERKLSPVAAMAVVYKSPFYRKLQDPETGLYRESSSYLLNLFNASFQRNAGLFAIAREGCLSGLQRGS